MGVDIKGILSWWKCPYCINVSINSTILVQCSKMLPLGGTWGRSTWDFLQLHRSLQVPQNWVKKKWGWGWEGQGRKEEKRRRECKRSEKCKNERTLRLSLFQLNSYGSTDQLDLSILYTHPKVHSFIWKGFYPQKDLATQKSHLCYFSQQMLNHA